MRVFSPLRTLGLAILLLLVVGVPSLATQGFTPGYDREFNDFLQTQGAAIQPGVVLVEARFTRIIHEEGHEREITIEGDFASGFIYNEDGIVITEYTTVRHAPSSYYSSSSGHSAIDADYILVRLSDGRQYEADVVGLDGPTALAVLQLKNFDPETITPVPIGNSSDVLVGEPILYLGYNFLSRSQISYDFGVISALRPQFPTLEESSNQYFQINVPQNYGNEGGVVINSLGSVIAIMTDIAPYPDATEIHFGLPINAAVEVVEAIINDGEMHRPWLGFRLLEMSPQIERAYSIIDDMDGDGLITDEDRDMFEEDTGIDLRECLFVIWVSEDSPGSDVGLQEADILMEFNGVPVSDMIELMNEMSKYRVGDLVTLEWMRREYAVWDPYIGEIELEYSGQREDEEDEE